MGSAAEPDRVRAFEVIKDNFEAFTIALIMALVIKHFCVEAFKIPTSSMKPTLHGDNETPGIDGDRILVDKWAYLFSGPERWDVIVFRYPLDRSKHFIKRVGGVGPEWIRIEQGEVWTRETPDAPWRDATKPRHIRESLYAPIYPPPDDAGDRGPDAFWEAEEGWKLEDHDVYRFTGGAPAELAFEHSIGSRNVSTVFPSLSGSLVRDIRIRCDVLPEGEGAVTLRWRTHDGEDKRLRLSTEEGASEVVASNTTGSEIRRAVPARLEIGRAMGVELECVDGLVIVHIDGKEVVRLEDGRDIADLLDFGGEDQRLEITAEGGPLEVRNTAIDRDLYYSDSDMSHLDRDGDGLYVPAGHYFMLGDNTYHSSDSRKWSARLIHLVDGSVIAYDATPSNSNYPRMMADGLKHVTDVLGVDRAWNEDHEDPSGPTEIERRPFVARALVVGKAFFVFWPLGPSFPGRLGFIH